MSIRLSRFLFALSLVSIVLISARADEVSSITSEHAAALYDGLSPPNPYSGTCSMTNAVWVDEIARKHVHAGKAFIFLTTESKLYSKYHFWFHSAPYVKVADQIMILDRDYEKAPVPLAQWVKDTHGESTDCDEAYQAGWPKDTQDLRVSLKCAIRLTDEKEIIYPADLRHDSNDYIIEYEKRLIQACQSAFAPQLAGRPIPMWSAKRCRKFLGREN